MSKNIYSGACQCGSLKFHFSTALAPADWRVRRCTCSFCRQHPKHIHVSDPEGSVRYEFLHKERVSRFRFGTKTADFITCNHCGSYIGAVMLHENGNFAVLNVEHLSADLRLPTPPEVSFDGEDLEQRLARRNSGWTPVEGEV
ncbi:MAG: hypothetical protein O3C28_02025 [Proteobacteria bacterium]|nr:hypothetical protein [Pseudomonadota bacterium]